jgi:hypothetical protein
MPVGGRAGKRVRGSGNGDKWVVGEGSWKIKSLRDLVYCRVLVTACTNICGGGGGGGAGTPGRAEERSLKGVARSVSIINKGNVATVKDGRETGERRSEASTHYVSAGG